MLKQITDKSLQQGKKAYFAFIDLEEASYRSRSKIWESLEQEKYAEK